jgi:hypothetical protein
MYRVKSTGEIKSQGEVRSMYPNTSFPSQWTPALVEELGLDPVFESPTPTTTRYQTAFKDGVEQDAQGRWLWKWSIGPVFTDNEEATAAEQESAYIARIDAEAAKSVRADRDKRLAECDWTQLSDSQVDKAVWATYRQALRDVPAQAGFPYDITWPEKP